MDLAAVMKTYAISGFYAITVDEPPPAAKPALWSFRALVRSQCRV